MATPRKVRDRRRFLVGIAVIGTGVAVTLGITALNAAGEDAAPVADRATAAPGPSATAGYLEGRRDAERGLPYQIDGAPAASPADDDDDDGTVGPQTIYRAGYGQGWCDGGGEPPA
jgi:hypothetical protein